MTTVEEALGHGPGPSATEPRPAPLVIIVGADKGGVGKEMPLYSKILTPSGWKTMGDMRIGMPICGADGKTYQVCGVFPQGIKPAYRISFTDGTSAECGLEHLWKTWSATNAARQGGWVLRTTKQLKDLNLRAKDYYYYRVPIIEPVQFASTSMPIDPYTLGVLIGDGYLVGNRCSFSVPPAKEPIKEKVGTRLAEGYCLKGPHGPEASPQWAISGGKRGKTNFLAMVRNLGLDVKSKERFIPEVYKTASISDRLELLRGLMDTDGSSKKGRTGFSTCSDRLALDVADLVRSLGGIAVVHRYDRSHHDKPVEYHINVRMRVCPFSLPYKAAGWVPASNLRGKYIKAIEYVADVEQQCIMTTAPDGLYVTDGYSATHNTTITRALVDYMAKCGAPLRAFDTEPADGGVLKQFYPRAEMLNAGTVPGQMRVIDSAGTDAVTLVDLRAGLLTPMLKAFHRIDLLEDVRKGALRLLVLHVVGSSVASASEVKPVMAALKGASLVRVNNKIAADSEFAAGEPGEVTIEIPNLEESAVAAVDQANAGFAAFAGDPVQSRVLRGYVRAWLADVHAAFDQAGIGGLLVTGA